MPDARDLVSEDRSSGGRRSRLTVEHQTRGRAVMARIRR
jgi:hypothetical protein